MYMKDLSQVLSLCEKKISHLDGGLSVRKVEACFQLHERWIGDWGHSC